MTFPRTSETLSDSNYQPSLFLDFLSNVLNTKTDSELAKRIGIKSPTISKIRYKKIGVTADVLLKIHDATGISIKDLKDKLGTVDFPKLGTR